VSKWAGKVRRALLAIFVDDPRPLSRANRHRDAVKGIAYMEAMVGRQYWDHWDKFGMRPVLRDFFEFVLFCWAAFLLFAFVWVSVYLIFVVSRDFVHRFLDVFNKFNKSGLDV